LKLSKANAATLELRVKELEESATASPKPSSSSIPSPKTSSAKKGNKKKGSILEPLNGDNALSSLSGDDQHQHSESTREVELVKQLANERQARAMYQRDSRDKQKQIDELRKQLSSFTVSSTPFLGGAGGGGGGGLPPSSSKRTSLLGNVNGSAGSKSNHLPSQQQQLLPSPALYSNKQPQRGGGGQTSDVPTPSNKNTSTTTTSTTNSAKKSHHRAEGAVAGSLLFTGHQRRTQSSALLLSSRSKASAGGGKLPVVGLDDPRNPFARGGGGSAKVVSTPAVTKSLETQFSRFTTPSTKNRY